MRDGWVRQSGVDHWIAKRKNNNANLISVINTSKLKLLLQRWPGDVICILSGVALPLAFAPFHLYPLSFLCLAILFYLLLLGETTGRTFWRGYLFGLGYFGLGVSWVSVSMVRFGGMSLPLSIALTVLLVVFLSIYIAGVGYLAKRFFSNVSAQFTLMLLFPALWTLLEWVRGWLFTGFPWIDLGYSQVYSPLAGLMPLLGVYGVSLVTAVIAGAIVSGFLVNGKARTYILMAVIAGIMVSQLLKLIDWSEPVGAPVKVSLIQGNIPQDQKWLPQQKKPTIDLYTRLTREHWDSDIIIWPETALPAYYHQAKDFLYGLAEEASKNNTSILMGIPFVDMNASQKKFYNSAVVLENGDMQFYHKYHLVPFGEYIPLKWALGNLLGFLKIPMADFSSSDTHQPVVRMGDLKAAVSICYEDAFGEEVINGLPEANFLINISNDAWFGDSLAPHQHMQKAQVRAQETGRPMLRATNNGISSVIDHKGNILVTSPQFQQSVLTAKIQSMQGATLYVLTGNYLMLILCFFMLASAAFVARKQE